MRIKRTQTPLSEATERLVQARKDSAEAQHRLKLAQEDVVRELTAAGKKSTSLVDGDKVYKATFVANDIVRVDEDGLRKALGAALWKKVSKTVLDRKKLEELVESGGLSAETVGAYTTVAKATPYVKVTEGVRKTDEE